MSVAGRAVSQGVLFEFFKPLFLRTYSSPYFTRSYCVGII